METLQVDLRFQCPCGIHVVGPTMSGKTTLTRELIRRSNDYFSQKFDRVVYCYSVLQNDFQLIGGDVEFIQGVDPILNDDSFFNSNENNLLILDDLMDKIANDFKAASLFTRGIHHKNVSVLFLYQNLFKQGKAMRDIALNTQYMILFKSRRDVQQIKYLGRQLGTPHLECAYRKAIKEPYGFLLINLHPHSDERIQLQSHFFQDRRIYCQR
jgi:hypothetical protein